MKYEITKEQIETLVDVSRNAEIRLKEWFPEAFKTVLEVGEWYKNIYGCLFCFNGNCDEEKDPLGYGFLSDKYENKWCDDNRGWVQEGLIKATESEVFEALKNEAVKRGFTSGVFVNRPDCFYGKGIVQLAFSKNEFRLASCKNRLLLNDYFIFENGIWAEIIPTITKEEAEKLLNKKII